jgi:ribosomal protection tetracycline resistance protein
MAMMKGLVNAKTALLEPLYRFRLSVPEELAGKLMNEITLMRGMSTDVPTVKDRAYIEGSYPVAEGLDFSVRLQALTGGRGQLSLDFGGYERCPEGSGMTAEYRGVNPLDRAKYILSIRGAL